MEKSTVRQLGDVTAMTSAAVTAAAAFSAMPTDLSVCVCLCVLKVAIWAAVNQSPVTCDSDNQCRTWSPPEHCRRRHYRRWCDGRSIWPAAQSATTRHWTQCRADWRTHPRQLAQRTDLTQLSRTLLLLLPPPPVNYLAVSVISSALVSWRHRLILYRSWPHASMTSQHHNYIRSRNDR